MNQLEGGDLEQQFSIGPGRTVRVRLGSVPASAESVETVLSPQDALPKDNRVRIVKSKGPSIVRICGRRNRYIEKALRVIPNIEVQYVWKSVPDAGPAVIIGSGCESLPPGDVVLVGCREKAGPIEIRVAAPGELALFRIPERASPSPDG